MTDGFIYFTLVLRYLHLRQPEVTWSKSKIETIKQIFRMFRVNKKDTERQ